ncbi:Rrf2 family transcriptional regulator [Stieleria sp. JC731]|uniref:RrF2 family transcriptional regulator n=1 Tax=Pirellulaceae TaxID=2691357 RepID=UPI001E611E1C|nr:Rrf2 family transcriptional regulator [Stieleria sp. JC731]MCC9601075.1 Rrf2 family transcriptional regulator [Stieleria sp. JC731]
MLSKTAEYALRSILCLASRDSAASADTLATETKVPRRYLTRVLQDLASAGFVTSRPGPGGGYVLSQPTDTTTILDVINVVDPIKRIKACPLGLKTHTELCPLHAKLDQAYADVESAFCSVTLKDLLESTSSIIPLCESAE